mmetsp:Transcript_1565/g.4635  ORF Transcript_1565/g.4635 Transcript_1565/m.4635 type:complete len:426 (+) Transcript_1565:354-1631(+)|eukprot:CAMPEP_0206142942 /NCGR_PEP_ID=MMETSP1473-20131121/18781_1 /ASSEMBLY_ACC=CAM_ASM_001109 /TAXON_ID=1461547 /ORGANISM="Stichococcus sp, Strain RCC1054" /LENGTH=425 /DNA_ID=CAMNT_0053538131 /DNA_START=251 /DNA_END=1528 /DNA_ORIENTATION=+
MSSRDGFPPVERRSTGDFRAVITPGSDRQASVITISHHSADEPPWQHDEDAALLGGVGDRSGEEAGGEPGTVREPTAPLISQASASLSSRGSGPSEAALQLAFNLSWVVNILLFAVKLWAYIVSHSKAVLASLADSLVDLVSQAVIAIADVRSKHADPRFPVGKARLEAVGVILCACLMTLSSFEVIRSSGTAIYSGFFNGALPELHLGLLMFAILGVATFLKLALYFFCVRLAARSDSMAALAEDHLNDVFSNAGAIVTAAVASVWEKGWWVDPVGAIIISLYIVYRWIDLCKGQIDKLVGLTAPADFVKELEELANTHHEKAFLDVIRAYHFGARYIVELEIVMPAEMTVAESHDISLNLQHKIEALDDVERCFVHVDYQTRDEPEHKVERGLSLKAAADLSKAAAAGGSGEHTTQLQDLREV